MTTIQQRISNGLKPFKNEGLGTSLVVQWLRLRALTAQIQSLVRELRSHKLCGVAK